MKKSIAKHFSISAILLALLALTACNSARSDGEKLLRTVPKDACMVAFFDVRETMTQIAKHTNFEEFKDDTVLGLPLVAFQSHAMVLFNHGGLTYLTGLLSDVDEFKQQYCRYAKGHFSPSGEFEVNKYCAIRDSQFWLCLSKQNPKAGAANFISLDEKNSFLTSDYAETLLSTSENFSFYINISELTQVLATYYNVSDTDKALLRQVPGLIFDKPGYLCGEGHFGNGKLSINGQVLNEFFKPAPLKYELPQIAGTDAKVFDGRASLLAAVSVGAGLQGVITPLLNTLSEAGMQVAAERNRVLIDLPADSAQKNALVVADQSSRLDGTYAGVIVGSDLLTAADPMLSFISNAALLARPQDGGVSFTIDFVTSQPSVNFLKTAAQALQKH